MQSIVNIILAIIIPWALGYHSIRFAFNNQLEQRLLRLGIGYLIGFFFLSLIMRIYNLINRDFNFYEMIIVMLMLAFLLFLLFKKKEASIYNEQVKNPKVSTASFILIAVICTLIIIRLLLILIDVIYRPMIPWDAWYSWTLKAKAIYYEGSIPNFTEFYYTKSFYDNSYPVGAIRHPIFLPMVQAFMAMANGEWQDSIINIPWVFAGLSIAFITYGGMRSLGVSALLATLSSYMVISLPILNIHMTLGSYGDLWVGIAYLTATITYAIAISQKQYNLIFITIVSMIIMVYTKNTSILLFPIFGVLIIRYFFSNITTVVLVILIVLMVIILENISEVGLAQEIKSILNIKYRRMYLASFQDKNIWLVWTHYFLLDNWHYLLPFTVLSSFFLLKKKPITPEKEGLEIIIIAGIFSLLIFLWVMVYSTIMSVHSTTLINRITLYFAPLLILTPISIYQITIGSKKKIEQALTL